MRLFQHGNLRTVAGRILLAALLLTVPCPAPGAEREDSQEPFRAYVGFTAGTFLNLNMDASQAVARLWSRLLLGKIGEKGESTIYRDISTIEKDLKSRKIDLVVLVASEYLELKDRALLEPLFVPTRNSAPCEHFVLVVRKDSGLRSIRDLRRKALIQQKGAYSSSHNIWLDYLLTKEGISDKTHYFSSLSQALKPSKALLPVFFRKADACIVTQSSLDVSGELNPQLRGALQVIAQSPPMPLAVIAVRSDYGSRHKKSLRERLESLHQNTEGRQLLTLFQVTRLMPFKPEYLAPFEDFIKENKRLKYKMTKRKQ
jgi:ABC-type phosphate/phosphonate transport system substrate-binding protein